MSKKSTPTAATLPWTLDYFRPGMFADSHLLDLRLSLPQAVAGGVITARAAELGDRPVSEQMRQRLANDRDVGHYRRLVTEHASVEGERKTVEKKLESLAAERRHVEVNAPPGCSARLAEIRREVPQLERQRKELADRAAALAEPMRQALRRANERIADVRRDVCAALAKKLAQEAHQAGQRVAAAVGPLLGEMIAAAQVGNAAALGLLGDSADQLLQALAGSRPPLEVTDPEPQPERLDLLGEQEVALTTAAAE